MNGQAHSCYGAMTEKEKTAKKKQEIPPLSDLPIKIIKKKWEGATSFETTEGEQTPQDSQNEEEKA